AGADGYLQHTAPGARTEPFPPAAEPGLLEKRDLLVVAGCVLVPHPFLPGRRGLAGGRLGGAGHRAGPSVRTGSGSEQSTSDATAAPMTPITACRTRPAARAGSGCPASSQ